MKTSLQSQNPLSQAQNSVEGAHNAVSQAQTHPAPQTIDQAFQAIEHAEHAVNQAWEKQQGPEVERLSEMLAQEKRELMQCQQQFQNNR